MRILILSCNTGEGHNSCAKALKEVFDEKGHYCVIENALEFVSKNTSTVISKGYTFIYRHLPGAFRLGYNFAEKHPGAYYEGSLLYKYFCRGKQRLADYIDSGEFDIVICTHVVAGILVTDARKVCATEFLTAFVSTDYTCSPTTEASDLDLYFIPDDTLKNEFTEYGIPEAKLVPGGIPVRQMFHTNTDKESAKIAEGIDASHRHLLVMSSSMGCGPIETLVFLISKSLREDEELTVVCGTNKRMKKKLETLHRNSPNIHIRGYVTDMSSLMDSADLYLTKPGGISVTEAKHKRLPMAFVDAVAGYEEYNRRFFVEKGCAVSAKNIISLSKRCIAILRDGVGLSKMEACFDNVDRNNSAQFICEYLTNIIICKNRITKNPSPR
ncbi:MAG: glycosyltransferase [Eubacteriales bacterium]